MIYAAFFKPGPLVTVRGPSSAENRPKTDRKSTKHRPKLKVVGALLVQPKGGFAPPFASTCIGHPGRAGGDRIPPDIDSCSLEASPRARELADRDLIGFNRVLIGI